jgi:hypothetical protein
MDYSFITNWISKEEAQAKVKSLIADGVYKKGEIKLSSYRWADLSDHSKGYLARVHVLSGLHPELELGACGRKKKAAPAPKVETVEELPADDTEFNTVTIRYNDCIMNGEMIQQVEVKADLTSEQIELLQSDADGQGHEIALSLAEDFNIDEFNRYELVA